MTKINPTAALAAAFALALSGAAFASDPMAPAEPVTPVEPTSPIEPATPVDPMMAPAAPTEVTFEQLDTDADGYVAKSDIPADHELAIQFADVDTNSDARLSRAEFDAYQDAPEEEEAEE